jgi:hypothetical protein
MERALGLRIWRLAWNTIEVTTMLRAARCLAAFALGIALLLSAPPAGAMTTVSVDGTTVVIHVPIEVVGVAGEAKIQMVDQSPPYTIKRREPVPAICTGR